MNKAATISLSLDSDQFAELKLALMKHIQSKDVTLTNFDSMRELYGRLAQSWSTRTYPETKS